MPNNAEAYWNLSGTAETLVLQKWLEECLRVNPKHLKAKLAKSALQFYEGDPSKFNEYINSPLKNHPFIRSCKWAFNLPKLPRFTFIGGHYLTI